MSTTFTLNRDQVITGALRILGVIGQGQAPDSTQISEAAEALNVLVKAWQADGLQVWKITTATVDLVEGKAEYRTDTDMGLPNKPLKVWVCTMYDVPSGSDAVMIPLANQDYKILSNKNSKSVPSQYYYQPMDTYGVLTLYPNIAASTAMNKKVKMTYSLPLNDVLGPTDVLDFPSEWNRALKYALAVELAYEYGYPTKDRDRLIQHAAMIKDEVLGWDVENASIFFEQRKY